MWSVIKGFFWLVVFLVLMFVIGRIFFFEIARTDSYSMVPNILAGLFRAADVLQVTFELGFLHLKLVALAPQ